MGGLPEKNSAGSGTAKGGGASLLAAANLLMLSTIASRILGYLRDVLIFAKFGQNNLTDAYNAAFSIPDFPFWRTEPAFWRICPKDAKVHFPTASYIL